jgi:hypothetical protein
LFALAVKANRRVGRDRFLAGNAKFLTREKGSCTRFCHPAVAEYYDGTSVESYFGTRRGFRRRTRIRQEKKIAAQYPPNKLAARKD